MEEIKPVVAVEEEVKEPTEEGETEVAEEGKEEVKSELDGAKDALKNDELSLKERDKVQARIDDLTAKLHEQDRMIAELKSASKPKQEDNKPKWTEEKLIEVLNDPNRSQSEIAWAQRELNKLDTQNMLQGVLDQQRAVTAKQSSIDKAAEQYPDLLDTTSNLWKAANDIYLKQGLDRIEDGQYIAAQLAVAQLNLPALNKTAVLQKRVDKQNAKTSLASGGKKVAVNNSSNIDKLRAQAMEAGPDSVVWRQWQTLVAKAAYASKPK